jgi:hypothetical protein
MALKNYRSESTTTFDTIQKCLAAHRAKQVFFEYNDAGQIASIAFTLEIDGRHYPFRLPARVANVERLFYEEKNARTRSNQQTRNLTDTEREQAYRTAWANIRDWLTAQMALIDTGMVKAQEVLLPYMLTPQGKTYYETLEQRRFLLEGPEEPAS